MVRQLNCLGSDDSGHTIFDRGVKYDDGFREGRAFLNKSCSRSRTSDSGHTISERSPIYDHDPSEGRAFLNKIVLTLEN